MPAVYCTLNGHCNKQAGIYTLENSRSIVRKAFQITIVIHIHEFKQISLEKVVFFFFWFLFSFVNIRQGKVKRTGWNGTCYVLMNLPGSGNHALGEIK